MLVVVPASHNRFPSEHQETLFIFYIWQISFQQCWTIKNDGHNKDIAFFTEMTHCPQGVSPSRNDGCT